MTDDPLDAMKARWNHIQGTLFPWLREEVDPMTEALGRLVTTLDVIGLEAFVPKPARGAGRPPEDRRALARAFVAKAVLGVPTTTALTERLDVDRPLRRMLGWERRSRVLSEATFCRTFAEFAEGDLPARMHAAMIERSLAGRIVGAIARDATKIEAREKPIKKEPNYKKDESPPDGARPTRKRGRPRKGEQRPKPEAKVLAQTFDHRDQAAHRRCCPATSPCRPAGRRYGRHDCNGARTKSELLLDRLRRSSHIGPQWNSCDQRLCGPSPPRSRSFSPKSTVSLPPARRFPGTASADAASRRNR
jgi:Transposase domain (DUF772)